MPGIGTHVDGDLKKYMDTNENPKAQTAQVGTNPHNVATISYLGYVAPEGPGGKIYQAANISYADEAAPNLARFEEGLRASGNTNGHSFTNTVIGHSYRSTTAGKAMTQVAEGAVDNFIMCGSPGAGAESTGQNNVPEGHVYESSVPEGDAVQGLGPDSEYGTNPQEALRHHSPEWRYHRLRELQDSRGGLCSRHRPPIQTGGRYTRRSLPQSRYVFR